MRPMGLARSTLPCRHILGDPPWPAQRMDSAISMVFYSMPFLLENPWWFLSSKNATSSSSSSSSSGWWYTYPSENMSSSVGMMTFPTDWKVIYQSCSKPPTSHHHHLQRSTSPIFSLWIFPRLFHQCLDELWGAGASGSTITRDRYGIWHDGNGYLRYGISNLSARIWYDIFNHV